MMKFTVLSILLIALSLAHGALLTSEAPEATFPIEGAEQPVKEEAVTADEVDIADEQNAEDDPDQRRVVCTPGVEFLADPRNCGRFYQCSNGIPYRFDCPAGLYFNINTNVCDWPSNVNCGLDRCDRRRVGRLSGTGDDDESRTRCPRGYVPVNCVASNPRRSDGTVVSDRFCTAVNSFRASGQRAIATCVSADDGDFLFERSGSWERNPEVRCPRGYRVINCFIRNAWNHMRFVFPRMDVGRNSCGADITCSAGDGCIAQAVCRRI